MIKKSSYPYIALGIGLCLLLIVLKGSEVRSDGVPVIPLLTLLVISEFAFFATAIGAYIGVRHMLSSGVKPVYAVTTTICVMLSLYFAWLGVELWPL